MNIINYMLLWNDLPPAIDGPVSIPRAIAILRWTLGVSDRNIDTYMNIPVRTPILDCSGVICAVHAVPIDEKEAEKERLFNQWETRVIRRRTGRKAETDKT
jgi:hypothetical protein